MNMYFPPRSTSNVSMPWMRRLADSLGMVSVAPSSCSPMIESRSRPTPDEIAVVDPLLLQASIGLAGTALAAGGLLAILRIDVVVHVAVTSLKRSEQAAGSPAVSLVPHH